MILIQGKVGRQAAADQVGAEMGWIVSFVCSHSFVHSHSFIRSCDLVMFNVSFVRVCDLVMYSLYFLILIFEIRNISKLYFA